MKKIINPIYSIALMAVFLFAACNTSQSQNIKNINVNEAEKIIKDTKDVVILDVRTPGEYSEGHLENSMNIDIYSNTFDAEIAKLDKTKTYVVICKSGGRSSNACDKMDKMGFKTLHNVQGGFTAWSGAGKKSVK
jgi:rhodanese-related sulfurtransferase